MKINFIDLERQQARIGDVIRKNIENVLGHGKYIMGPEIVELEERLASYTDSGYAVAVSSGTDALLMALMACGVGPGDAVFTTPFSFIATAEVIALLGATPVFVDIDPVTFNLDPAKLKLAVAALKNVDPASYPLPEGVSGFKPRGIIAVDLFGQTADYDAIQQIARENDLFVIEDAAQSFGALYKGKKACSLGDISATSFFPAKPLGCYGDGGMVFTDDESVAQRLRSIRVHGKGSNKYDNIRVGINGRMDTMQAAVLLAKLEVFDDEIEQRQVVAGRYNDMLGACDFVRCPVVKEGRKSAWAQYSLLTDSRDEVLECLKNEGIPTAVYYPSPMHLQPGYAYLGHEKGDFPVAEDAAGKIFSIPMHPYLSGEEQEYITGHILNCGN